MDVELRTEDEPRQETVAARQASTVAFRYEQIGELPGWPGGSTRVFFRTAL